MCQAIVVTGSKNVRCKAVGGTKQSYGFKGSTPKTNLKRGEMQRYNGET